MMLAELRSSAQGCPAGDPQRGAGATTHQHSALQAVTVCHRKLWGSGMSVALKGRRTCPRAGRLPPSRLIRSGARRRCRAGVPLCLQHPHPCPPPPPAPPPHLLLLLLLPLAGRRLLPPPLHASPHSGHVGCSAARSEGEAGWAGEEGSQRGKQGCAAHWEPSAAWSCSLRQSWQPRTASRNTRCCIPGKPRAAADSAAPEAAAAEQAPGRIAVAAVRACVRMSAVAACAAALSRMTSCRGMERHTSSSCKPGKGPSEQPYSMTSGGAQHAWRDNRQLRQQGDAAQGEAGNIT